MPVDVLAIAAHRDDVELTCAGTLLRAADAGHRTGILDLTAGESATRGSAEVRAEEAERAGAILGITERRNAGLPDAHLRNSDETRRAVVEQIRHFAPRVVILPFPVGRHPDHRVASELGRDACFLAGLAKYDAAGTAHRPFKIFYALSYREDPAQADLRGGHQPASSTGSWPPSAAMPASSTAPRRPARSFRPARTCTRWSTPRTRTTAP